MNFIKVDTYDKLSAIAANIIAAQVTLKPDCVLGLATGSSPLGTYAKLAEKYNAGELDFSAVTSVNLDEYVGLDGSCDQSYRYFMDNNLFCNINIDKSNTYVPNGCAKDLKAEGEAYDGALHSPGSARAGETAEGQVIAAVETPGVMLVKADGRKETLVRAVVHTRPAENAQQP